MFVILAAITAIFLLPLFVFCFAARKHLKHPSRTLQDDPIGLKVDLKIGSHNGRLILQIITESMYFYECINIATTAVVAMAMIFF